MVKLRKQYSSKYQVVEYEVECEDWEKATYESANMDAKAKVDLQGMLDVAKTFELEEQTTYVPKQATTKITTNSAYGSLATDGQKGCLRKNGQRASAIALKLGISYDLDTLTKADAMKIINEMVKSNNTGI